MENVADMPEQDENGNWYDLETGLSFDSRVHYKSGGKITKWTPSEDVKNNRKIAKFYGAKALTGSAKQKVWAESLRASVLTSDSLSDEQKADFLDSAKFLQTSKFWINNKDISPSYFTKENLTREYRAVTSLANKHYETIGRTRYTHLLNTAREEIYDQLKLNKFDLYFDFGWLNFNPYDSFGCLKR